MIGDVVFVDEGDEVFRRVATQCRYAKMKILGEEVFGGGVNVREVASATARDPDFFCGLGGMV